MDAEGHHPARVQKPVQPLHPGEERRFGHVAEERGGEDAVELAVGREVRHPGLGDEAVYAELFFWNRTAPA